MSPFTAFVLLSACEPVVTPLEPVDQAVPAPYLPADDVEFVDVMSAHHRAAIAMAGEEVERGVDPTVVAMAEEIRALRVDELDAMQRVRAQLTRAPETPMEPDVHLAMDLHVLGARSGPALDRSFLEEMIGHHARGLDLAHHTRLHLGEDELFELAAIVEARQAREIGRMRELLDALTATRTD